MDPGHIEARLAAAHDAAFARLSAAKSDFNAIVAASVDSNADDEHDPEGATIAFERSQVETTIGQARSKLDEIERAHERLAAGTYGSCERCGQPIAEDRLAARPTASTCITCAGTLQI